MVKKIRNENVDKAWFETRLKEKEITQNELARKLNLDRGSMSRTLNGERLFAAEELGAISIILQQPLAEVARHAGIQFWQSEAFSQLKKSEDAQAQEAINALARALGLKPRRSASK